MVRIRWDYWQNLQDRFEEELPFEDELSESYITLRPVKLNASLNYGFGYGLGEDCDCFAGERFNRNNLGAHIFAIKRPQDVQTAYNRIL